MMEHLNDGVTETFLSSSLKCIEMDSTRVELDVLRVIFGGADPSWTHETYTQHVCARILATRQHAQTTRSRLDVVRRNGCTLRAMLSDLGAEADESCSDVVVIADSNRGLESVCVSAFRGKLGLDPDKEVAEAMPTPPDVDPHLLPDAADLFVALGAQYLDNHKALIDAVVPLLRRRLEDMMRYVRVCSFYADEWERLSNKYEFFVRALVCRSYSHLEEEEEEDADEDIGEEKESAVEIDECTRFQHSVMPGL